MEVEDQEFVNEGECWWTTRDRVVIARMEQYLDRSDCMKVEVDELELLLGPEDSEVDSRYILSYARRKKGAGSPKFSGRRVRVSSWYPAGCDGTGVGWCW